MVTSPRRCASCAAAVKAVARAGGPDAGRRRPAERSGRLVERLTELAATDGATGSLRTGLITADDRTAPPDAPDAPEIDGSVARPVARRASCSLHGTDAAASRTVADRGRASPRARTRAGRARTITARSDAPGRGAPSAVRDDLLAKREAAASAAARAAADLQRGSERVDEAEETLASLRAASDDDARRVAASSATSTRSPTTVDGPAPNHQVE